MVWETEGKGAEGIDAAAYGPWAEDFDLYGTDGCAASTAGLSQLRKEQARSGTCRVTTLRGWPACSGAGRCLAWIML
jgi:hypothetical protein